MSPHIASQMWLGIPALSLQICSSPSMLCWLYRSFVFLYKLKNQLIDIYKVIFWFLCFFNWDYVKFIDQVEENEHFENIESYNPYIWTISPYS